MRGKGSKVCRGPHAYREAGANVQPQQGTLDAEGLALGSSPGSQAEGTTNLLTPTGLCQQSAVASSSHILFSTAAPWPPAPGLRPRTAGVKQRQNSGTLGETQKDLQAMSSAWEASFSPSPSWQCSFWAHNTGPLLLLLLTEGKEIRGSHIPTHPPRKQFSVSDPSFFNNIGW